MQGKLSTSSAPCATGQGASFFNAGLCSMTRRVGGPREPSLVLDPMLEQVLIQIVIFHPLWANSAFYPSLHPYETAFCWVRRWWDISPHSLTELFCCLSSFTAGWLSEDSSSASTSFASTLHASTSWSSSQLSCHRHCCRTAYACSWRAPGLFYLDVSN